MLGPTPRKEAFGPSFGPRGSFKPVAPGLKPQEPGKIPGSPYLPKVHFGSNKFVYKALVDSGSDISLLSESVFEKIPRKNVLSFKKQSLASLQSASGHALYPYARAQVRMYISNIPCVISFVLIKNFSFRILLDLTSYINKKHN